MKRIVLFVILLPVIVPSMVINLLYFGWLTGYEIIDRFTEWIVDDA